MCRIEQSGAVGWLLHWPPRVNDPSMEFERARRAARVGWPATACSGEPCAGRRGTRLDRRPGRCRRRRRARRGAGRAGRGAAAAGRQIATAGRWRSASACRDTRCRTRCRTRRSRCSSSTRPPAGRSARCGGPSAGSSCRSRSAPRPAYAVGRGPAGVHPSAASRRRARCGPSCPSTCWSATGHRCTHGDAAAGLLDALDRSRSRTAPNGADDRRNDAWHLGPPLR